MNGPSADEAPGILADLVRRRPEIAPVTDQIQAAFDLLRTAFTDGHKLLTCGNGGSAADAGHIVGELMKSMSRRRPLPRDETAAFDVVASAEQRDYLVAHLERALPAIDLGSQQVLLSAIGNDTADDMGFAQQVIGYGRPGTCSGGCPRRGDQGTWSWPPRRPGARALRPRLHRPLPSPLGALADVTVRSRPSSTPQVQELHLPIYHALCEMLEAFFFSSAAAANLGTEKQTR